MAKEREGEKKRRKKKERNNERKKERKKERKLERQSIFQAHNSHRRFLHRERAESKRATTPSQFCTNLRERDDEGMRGGGDSVKAPALQKKGCENSPFSSALKQMTHTQTHTHAHTQHTHTHTHTRRRSTLLQNFHVPRSGANLIKVVLFLTHEIFLHIFCICVL